jgi:hypothetical protein
MEAASRKRLGALAAVLVVVSAAVVAVALSAGGGDEAPGGLRVERMPGAPEVVVYVEDLEANRAETADGAARITLECLNRDGQVVRSSRVAWPFLETDGGTLDPHVHLRMEPALIERVERCRLKDTDPPLEGRLV